MASKARKAPAVAAQECCASEILEVSGVHLIDARSRVKATAVLDVLTERFSQYELWGEQNHTPSVWACILTEEVGGFCKAALKDKFGDRRNKHGLRREAVQVAAVALAIVEFIDRRKF